MSDQNGSGSAFAALAAANKLKQEEAAKAMAENAQKHAGTAKVPLSESRTFYSRISGATYIFANGKVAQFAHGEYVTNKAAEIQELEDLCAHPGNHVICKDQVPVQNTNDAIFAKDVSNSGTQSSMVRGLTTSLNQM